MARENGGRLNTPSMRLDGLIALVTGAGRGLGQGCAFALAEAGAEVILLSRTPHELEQTAEIIRAGGGTAEALCCDLTDSAQIEEKIGGLSRLDVLINNAGMNFPEPFVDVTEDHFDDICGLNFKAVFMASQAAARVMIAGGRGGAILTVSSQMGHVGAPNRTVYCATKHAVEGLTKALGVELAPYKIRANSIGPTFIETPMTKPFFDDPAFREDTLGRIPLGHLGQIEDIMGAVVFLCSPAAALITGTSLLIDGGWTAQ